MASKKKEQKGRPVAVSVDDIVAHFGAAAHEEGATQNEVAEIKDVVTEQSVAEREDGASAAEVKQLITFSNSAARQEYQRKGVNGLALADHLPIRSVRAFASEHGPWTAEGLRELRRVDDSAPEKGATGCFLCNKKFLPEAIRLILPKMENGKMRFALLTRGDKPEWAGNFVVRKEGGKDFVVVPACGTLSDPDSCISFLRAVKEVREKEGEKRVIYFLKKGANGQPMLDKHGNTIIDRKPAVTYESGMAYITSVKERHRLAAEEAERGRLAAVESERKQVNDQRVSRLGALTHRARVSRGWK